MTNELQILIESLQKKEKILKEILGKSKEQYALAEAEKLEVEQFDALVDEKAQLLSDMEKLDEGFDATYQRIKEQLLKNKDMYSKQIAELQQLIQSTMDLGAQICTTESRTKDKLAAAITVERQDLIQKKVSMKAVANYYKESNNLKYIDPYFMDSKK